MERNRTLRRFSSPVWDMRTREHLAGILFVLPALIGIALFMLFPIGRAFYISFCDYNLLKRQMFFIGIANYVNLFHDKMFIKSLVNVAYFAGIVIPLQPAFSLLLALLVNREIKGIGFFRAAYFIPSITSTVVVAVIWGFIYHPYQGLLNAFLKVFHIPPQGFLTDPSQAMLSIVILCIWAGGGFFMMIFLSGLKQIPSELYEAARIDGANAFRQFLNITLPLLKRTILLTVVINTTGSFLIFTPIYALTKGGPQNSTITPVFYLFRMAFEYLKMGYASAIAFIMLVLIAILVIAEFAILRSEAEY